MAEPRVVSLIASATEIVCALGGEDLLVGRSHECDYPAGVTGLPQCSYANLDPEAPAGEIDRQVKSLLSDALSIYGLHAETIDGLSPTHLITQTQCDVCAVSLSDVQAAACERFSSEPEIVVLEPHGLADVWEDIRTVGRALGLDPEPLCSEIDSRLEAVRRSVTGRAPVRVLCVEWPDPPMVAGNWIPELVELAGGVPVLGKPGFHSPWLDVDAAVAADPDVILVMPCGFGLQRSAEDGRALITSEPWASMRAVREGRVFAADGNAYFNRPGPRLADTAEILREVLHPDVGGASHAHAWQALHAS